MNALDEYIENRTAVNNHKERLLVIHIYDNVVESIKLFTNVKKAEEYFQLQGKEYILGSRNFTNEMWSATLDNGYLIGNNHSICLTWIEIEE